MTTLNDFPQGLAESGDGVLLAFVVTLAFVASFRLLAYVLSRVVPNAFDKIDDLPRYSFYQALTMEVSVLGAIEMTLGAWRYGGYRCYELLALNPKQIAACSHKFALVRRQTFIRPSTLTSTLLCLYIVLLHLNRL